MLSWLSRPRPKCLVPCSHLGCITACTIHSFIYRRPSTQPLWFCYKRRNSLFQPQLQHLPHSSTAKSISAMMKTTTFLVYLTCVTATIAVAIPSPAATEARITVEEQTATTAVERRDGSDAQIPVNGNSRSDDNSDNDDGDGEAGSCFCAGTSICCRKDGEVNCDYGLCGVWI